MYYDFEGHAIATSLADAASTLTEHEKADYFGYDCSGPCCTGAADNAELAARFATQDVTREQTITELTDLMDDLPPF